MATPPAEASNVPNVEHGAMGKISHFTAEAWELNQLDWHKLARDLNLNSAQEAIQRAYEIAAYVAEVERSRDQKLLLKEGRKFYTLTLSEIQPGS
jgi:hypothetical protein